MTKNKKYDLAVFITRAEPFHNGHNYIVNKAKDIAEEVLILIGSANASPSAKNPFNASERAAMIRKATQGVNIDYLDDFIYEENQWLAEVQELVGAHIPSRGLTENNRKPKICIIGHTKDETSYYLKHFPQWDLIDVEYQAVIDATQIRNLMFEGKLAFIKGAVPKTINTAIIDFMSTDRYQRLTEEYDFINDYKRAWAGSPYPPMFQTVDAVVVQSGHILLVQRGDYPGLGLWALPGGFIGENETLKNACIRELREETRLKVPEPVLRGSIVKEETFDAPGRSQRGRTITRAFFIQLDDDQDLPKTKGGDDAARSDWFSFADFYDMAEEMYEDHYHIVRKLLDNM